jgi:hypothetical protein
MLTRLSRYAVFCSLAAAFYVGEHTGMEGGNSSSSDEGRRKEVGGCAEL